MGVNAFIREGAVQARHVVLTESGLVVRVLGVTCICKINYIENNNEFLNIE